MTANSLSGRMQITDINSSLSAPNSIDISVIQGSILGPTLFSIYINDHHNAMILKTFTFLFADTSALNPEMIWPNYSPTLILNLKILRDVLEQTKWPSTHQR